MDAGLAKVLNSTVGTSAMKSLDKVLDGVIENVLTRTKSFIPSDERYYTFPQVLQTPWQGTGLTTEKSLITFTMPHDGSAYLKFIAGAQYDNNNFYLNIYVNGVKHVSYATSDAYGSDASSSLLFSFSKGDTIDIRVNMSSATVYGRVSLTGIYASIVSASTPNNITVKV